MSNILIDFTKDYGIGIIRSIVMGVLSYIALDLKKEYKKHIQDKTKKEVVDKVCNYVNEVYPNSTGEDKINIAITSTKEILKEKGIVISDLEIRVLLHNSIHIVKNELEVKNVSNNIPSK